MKFFVTGVGGQLGHDVMNELIGRGHEGDVYKRQKEFYVNKLGFSIIRENYRPERKDWKLDLRVNEQTELEIFAEENPPKRVNRPEACGLRHLALCVENVEQTAVSYTHLDVYKRQLLMSAGTLLSQLYLWTYVRKYVRLVKVPVRDILVHLKPVLVLFVPVLAYKMCIRDR